MEIRSEANIFISMLEKAGYEAYFVGGFVRDAIMGKASYDIDITTDAEPKAVAGIFSSFRVIETGIKHGTVTVIANGLSAEITTYRTETAYTDNRHPDSVSFCKILADDLSRRDFTVNAIAFNPKSGYTDLFGGFDDIKKRVIRCIGEPKKRFNEDALRILRALRFASVLGFEIEKSTSDAIHECKSLLKNISRERIAAELKRILCGENIRSILSDYYEIFCEVIPELSGMKGFDQHNFHHKYDVLEHTACVVENTPPEPVLRLAALFHDCAKPERFTLDENGVGHFYAHASFSAQKAREALVRLRFDSATVSAVEKLVRIHDSPIEESETAVRKKLNRYSPEIFDSLIKLQRADTLGLADEFHSRLSHFDRLEEIKNEILKKDQCFSLKKLDINGNDLIALGFEGKEIGKALDFLLESVIEERVENNKSELIKFIARLAPSG